MKCAICGEEPNGQAEVRWGPEYAHRTCVVSFNAGFDVAQGMMLDIVKNDRHAMTFQSLRQYRAALIAKLSLKRSKNRCTT